MMTKRKPHNVLYLLVDDMRPNAQDVMYTPNLKALAASSLTFERAYCNIAVCSPSRISFLTGRQPSMTKAWNFVNHFRQANCEEVRNETYFSSPDDVYKTVTLTNGGAGQCCSLCTAEAERCEAWTYTPFECNPQGGGLGPCGSCSLGVVHQGEGRRLLARDATRNFRWRSSPNARRWARRHFSRAAKDDNDDPSIVPISGFVGTLESRSWVTLPQHFAQAGYLTLSSGKIFHTEQGGNGPAPWDAPATGMPPLQDPPSWTPGFSMANVNAIAPMRPCESNVCSVNATLDGDVPNGTFQFCDKIIRNDAILKLNFAINNYRATNQTFFLAVGFRKPHLPFRHPAPWNNFYPNVTNISLALYDTLDKSVPPIAYRAGALGHNPYQAVGIARAQRLRRDYYASISWIDHNLGKVLDVLNRNPDVANNTLVVFHSDHGFSLGEHGQWEKFTNWEYGTRVPLIVRAPWFEKSRGKSTKAIVELVDVFPSIAELANNPVPTSYKLDGTSFAALLRNPKAQLAKNTSLSVFPRCPQNRNSPDMYWKRNNCDLEERMNFFSMGVTLREDTWRYTEWTHWDGARLEPRFDEKPIGIELYSHANQVQATFDGPWEQINQAGEPALAAVQSRLAAAMRYRYHGTSGRKLPEQPFTKQLF